MKYVKWMDPNRYGWIEFQCFVEDEKAINLVPGTVADSPFAGVPFKHPMWKSRLRSIDIGRTITPNQAGS